MSRLLLLFATFTLTKSFFWSEPKDEWTVKLGGKQHQTQMRGGAVNFGSPISADIAFKVPNSNTWIIGANDGGHLKMVKILVTGANTYDWIESKYTNYLEKNPSCDLKSFKISCWNDANKMSCNSINECRNAYQVKLVAEKGKQLSIYRCENPNGSCCMPHSDRCWSCKKYAIVQMGQDCPW